MINIFFKKSLIINEKIKIKKKKRFLLVFDVLNYYKTYTIDIKVKNIVLKNYFFMMNFDFCMSAY